MRALLCFALLLPTPAFAETLLATSRITAVTIYPQGAEVVREVSFTAPDGSHELLITDLPAGIVPQLIRLAPADGLSVGAYALRTDRLPPRDPALTPDLQAAQAAIDAAQLVVQQAQGAVDLINAAIEAAEAQAGFLRGVRAEGDTTTADALRGIARMIGSEVLLARQAALDAGKKLPAAIKAVEDAQKALVSAQEAYDAASQGDEGYVALSVAVSLAAAGERRLVVSHYIGDASWQPVYDLRLTRQPSPALAVARGVLVSQSSGEDWTDVALTLSTAQPSAQAQPSTLWPELRRIVSEDETLKRGEMSAGARAPAADMMVVEAAMEPTSVAVAKMQGDVVVYVYPQAVDVASGVENLRLALDELALVPQIEARAVPRLDSTAFVLATFTNTTDEILLPGEAFLLREGTLVGSVWLDTIAAGDEAEVAFGAIEALRLTRDMPLRAEGDRGFLTTSSQIQEQAILKVKNLGTETWPVRLLDMVPYSEQEELEITFTADPAPLETDVEGQRGLLAWEFDLGPGEERQITLDHLISWPEGMVLQ